MTRSGWAAEVLVVALLAVLPWRLAAAETKLVVASPHAVLFDTGLIFAVAKEKGFFKEVGLDVETVIVAGGGENVQAVVSGSVQIAIGTGTLAVMSAFQKGAPVRIISAEMTGADDLYWYSMATTPYRRMEDIAGKRIAFSNPGSSSHQAVLAVVDQLKARGLPGPYPVALGRMPDIFTAIKTGQAEAGFAAVPLFMDRLEKGEIQIVFKGQEIEKLREVTVRVNFARRDWAERNPETVRAFLRAYGKTMDYMFANRAETARIWIQHGKLDISEATAVKAIDFYPRASVALKPIKGIPATVEDAIKFKFLTQPLGQAELDKLIDLRYVP
ncbi:MAG TPA: ABC transporter substrate-binding protein [Methylomirabilota bacterium]|jgi:NitT/TauT family transport system substrate-binding protein|nr:ABC transporter substrate-binding protein [Methylomirabilota bacterium]